MKTILTILTVMLLTETVNAQWYVRKYQVLSITELNSEQLEESLKTCKDMKTAGWILIVPGTAFIVSGLITYAHNSGIISPGKNGDVIGTVGTLVLATGLALVIEGNMRTKKIQIAMGRLKQTSMIAPAYGVGIKIIF